MDVQHRTNWTVAWICCFLSFLHLGVARLSGLLFVAVMDHFKASRSEASLPFMLSYTVRNISGPLVGYLGRRWGFHKVCATGCIITTVGLGLCFFAESVIFVTVMWGGVFGFGYGLTTILIPVVIRQHFSKDIAKANGVAFGGECLAGFVLPVLFDISLKKYGTQGTFLILSGLILNSFPAVLFLNYQKLNTMRKTVLSDCKHDLCAEEEKTVLRSYSVNHGGSTFPQNKLISESNLEHLNTIKCSFSDANFTSCCSSSNTKDTRLLDNSESYKATTCNDSSHLVFSHELSCKEIPKANKSVLSESNESTPIKCSFSETNLTPSCTRSYQKGTILLDNNKHYAAITTKDPSHSVISCEESCIEIPEINKSTQSESNKRSAMKSFTVFLDLTFILILLVQSLYLFIVTTVLTIVVDFSLDIDVDSNEQIYIVMGMSVADLIGRFGLGVVTDSNFMSLTSFTAAGFFVMGVLLLVSVWIKGFLLLMIVMLPFALLLGGLLIVFPGIVLENIEEDKITMALASRMSLYGPLGLTQSQMIGFFRGQMLSYDGVFYTMVVLCILCCILTVLTPLAADRRNRKKKSLIESNPTLKNQQ